MPHPFPRWAPAWAELSALRKAMSVAQAVGDVRTPMQRPSGRKEGYCPAAPWQDEPASSMACDSKAVHHQVAGGCRRRALGAAWRHAV